jgi:hypothetical protein
MKIIDLIASQAGLARFASFTYCSRSTGEVARYTLQLGFSYRNILQKSIMELEVDKQIMTDLPRQAADEILASLNASLSGIQTKYTKKDIYEDYKDSNGKTVQGIKVNKNDGSLKIFGLVSSKVQITPPVTPYKEVKSAPLTIEKNRITKTLPIGRFREFALDNLAMAKLNGETLILE